MIKIKNGMGTTIIKEISFTKALGVLIGTVISTAVVTSFTLLRVAQSDHFRIISLDSRVIALEDEIVPRGEFILQIENLGKSIDKHFKIQDDRLSRIEDLLMKGGE